MDNGQNSLNTNGYASNQLSKSLTAIKHNIDDCNASTTSNDSISDQSFFALSRSRCDSLSVDDEKESKVLVIYTGGTIGMIRNDDDGK